MPPALRIESLWKCYAAGIRGCSARAWILRGLSLTVHAGERVAIVGAAGSGKTTLADCICGLRAPMAGLVEVAGTLEIVDLQKMRWSGCQKAGPWEGRDPTIRRSGPLTSSILFARRPDLLESWADRVLVLRDGRLREMGVRPVLRVAERSMTTPSGAIPLR